MLQPGGGAQRPHGAAAAARAGRMHGDTRAGPESRNGQRRLTCRHCTLRKAQRLQRTTCPAAARQRNARRRTDVDSVTHSHAQVTHSQYHTNSLLSVSLCVGHANGARRALDDVVFKPSMMTWHPATSAMIVSSSRIQTAAGNDAAGNTRAAPPGGARPVEEPHSARPARRAGNAARQRARPGAQLAAVPSGATRHEACKKFWSAE